MGNFYLNSYIPLIAYKERHSDIERLRIPPYVDASCRREPDFESKYPAITALCRLDRLVKRLQAGDKVVYRTNKGRYDDYPEQHWRVVAGLEVIAKFDNHQDGKKWYMERKLPLPANCMVAGNPPKGESESTPLKRTKGNHASIREWDKHYRVRSISCGLMAVCWIHWVNLWDPPIWTDADEWRTFGEMKYTLYPPTITAKQFRAFMPMI